MTTRRRAISALLILCFTSFAASQLGQAQDKDIDTNPARNTVISYLTYSMGQEWGKAAALIDEKSLAGLKDRYVARIGKARTVQEELEMCRALDCLNLDAVKKLDPTDFYLRYNQGVEKQYKVSEVKFETIMKTRKVKVLSLAEETHNGEDLAHVLVRIKYNNGMKDVSNLELISLIKVNGNWQVTMEASRPTVTEPATGDAAKK